MDKIQFNNEVVSMRKTVKRAKVQTINQITRQVKILGNKKGNPEQLEKNRKRCERLLADIQAMKDWGPDDVTYAALATHLSLRQEKKEQGTGTPRDRALFRLTQHKLFVKQLATFKDLVTTDLLQAENIQQKTRKQKEPKETKSLRLPKAPEENKMAPKVKENSNSLLSNYKPPTPPELSNGENGEDDDDDDDEDDDEEEFFMPSKLTEVAGIGKTDGLCVKSLTSDSRSDHLLPHSTRENRDTISDSEAKPAESEDEETSPQRLKLFREDVTDDSKRKKGKPAVDLPYSIKTDVKKKHIPGISAPIIKPLTDTKYPEAIKEVRKGCENQSAGNNRLQPRNPPTRLLENRIAKPKKRKIEATKRSKSESTDEKLHPSWLARKAQKQRESSVRKFEGKKITFDDD